MIKILISGANGRMGKKVKEACDISDVCVAVCGVNRAEDFTNKSFPVYADFKDVKEDVDVVIDFSAPSNLNNVLGFITDKNTGAVLCATGYSDEQEQAVKNASKKRAVFRSANMSLGVNVLINAVRTAAKQLYGFDVEIIEKHHNKKADAPSGTALMIANAIKNELPEKTYVFGREGNVGKRTKEEIGIHAVRGGNIVGEHDVLFAGENEMLTFSHSAFDRAVFADGAIKAAAFISDKPCGLYDMNDLLSAK